MSTREKEVYRVFILGFRRLGVASPVSDLAYSFSRLSNPFSNVG
jgi:hypothetical protein